MAEYLINTLNRLDIKISDLVLINNAIKLLQRQLNTIKLSFPQAKRVGNPSAELRKIPDKPE